MNGKQRSEDKALKLSIVAQIAFSMLGIAVGLWLNSEVILFDGVYSFFGVAISFATLKISKYIHKQDHFNFPFGKEHLEPVVVLVQYMILGGFLLYALYGAVRVILTGGNMVELGGVILYLAANVLVLMYIVKRMRAFAAGSHSPLINTELVQWQISLRQSLFALGGYTVSLVLMWLAYENILAYVDPAVLIVFIALTFATLVKEVTVAFKELIGMRSVSTQFQQGIEAKVQSLVGKYHMKDYYLRVNKVGSVLAVEVDFLVDREFEHGSVYRQDEIREEFNRSLSDIGYEIWLSIAFTTQYKWMD